MPRLAVPPSAEMPSVIIVHMIGSSNSVGGAVIYGPARSMQTSKFFYPLTVEGQ